MVCLRETVSEDYLPEACPKSLAASARGCKNQGSQHQEDSVTRTGDPRQRPATGPLCPLAACQTADLQDACQPAAAPLVSAAYRSADRRQKAKTTIGHHSGDHPAVAP